MFPVCDTYYDFCDSSDDSGFNYYLFLFWIYGCVYYVFTFWLSYDLQLRFYTLDFLWPEIRVYVWGFPCLDYSFDVLVSWDSDLSIYNHFCSWSVLLAFLILRLCYIRSYILYLCSDPFLSLSHLAAVHLLLYVLTPWIRTFRFRG